MLILFPATKLANNRTPNETDLAKYEIVSIKTKSGTKPKGVPPGTKNENHRALCIYRPKIVTEIKMATLINIVTTALV